MIIIIIILFRILLFYIDFVCTCMQTEIYMMCRIQLFTYILLGANRASSKATKLFLRK